MSQRQMNEVCKKCGAAVMENCRHSNSKENDWAGYSNRKKLIKNYLGENPNKEQNNDS